MLPAHHHVFPPHGTHKSPTMMTFLQRSTWCRFAPSMRKRVAPQRYNFRSNENAFPAHDYSSGLLLVQRPGADYLLSLFLSLLFLNPGRSDSRYVYSFAACAALLVGYLWSIFMLPLVRRHDYAMQEEGWPAPAIEISPRWYRDGPQTIPKECRMSIFA